MKGHSNDRPQVAHAPERIDAQEAEGGEDEGEVKKGKGKGKGRPKKKASTTTSKKATPAPKASQKKTGSAAVAAGKE
jgi:hypothetical protein